METSVRTGPGLATAKPEKHIDKEQREVRIYTPTCILSGHIHCLHRQRLLDHLNCVLAGRLRTCSDFLPLTEITMRPSYETEDITKIALINKDNILFVVEIGQCSTTSCDGPYRSLPFIEKTPLLAHLHVPPYKLSGKMYITREQRLSDLLNTGERFLPVTNVKIVDPDGNSEKASFISVNKTKIIYAEEIVH